MVTPQELLQKAAPQVPSTEDKNGTSSYRDKQASLKKGMELDLSGVALAPGLGFKPVLKRSDTTPSLSNGHKSLDWDPSDVLSGQQPEGSISKKQYSARNASQVEEISPWTTPHVTGEVRQVRRGATLALFRRADD